MGAAYVTSNVFLRLAEVGLVLLLFTDASRTDLRVLRSIGTLPGRLLSTGMLLTILLGGIVARLVFPGLSIWEAGILAAILAPTDAGLGQVVVCSPRVPTRVREALNVEAGLNDGLSVPFLLFFMALAAAKIEGGGASLLQFIGEQLGLGVIVGIAVGLIGGWLLRTANRRGWVAESFEQIAVVTLPLLCLLVAEGVDASMFIASFVAGLAVQIPFKEAGKHSVEFAEEWGQILNLAVFFLFGMLIVRDWPQFTSHPLGLCGLKSDGGADATGRNCSHWDTPQPALGHFYGLVRPAWACVDCLRTGLSGAGASPAQRAYDSICRDADCCPEHFRPRPERNAGHQHLRTQDGRSRPLSAGTPGVTSLMFAE